MRMSTILSQNIHTGAGYLTERTNAYRTVGTIHYLLKPVKKKLQNHPKEIDIMRLYFVLEAKSI